MIDISLAVAFGAGLLSFLSPCILPLIPGYLSFLSGAGTDELRAGTRRAGVLYRTLFFVLGFSAVFVTLGLVFSGAGMLVVGRSNRILSIMAGAVLVVLGLNTMFDFLRFLNTEARVRVSSRPSSAAGAVLVGMAFGAGWTPCVGPILASILFMAARSGGASKAALLLSFYSAGLALPFIAAGLFFERLAPLWAWFKRHGRAVKTVSGALLVVIGLSMALGKMTAFNAAASRLGFLVRSTVVSNPAATKAWSLGLMAAFAAAIALPPVVRGRRFATPARLVFLGILAVLAVLELAGVISVAGILSGWLLFQGI